MNKCRECGAPADYYCKACKDWFCGSVGCKVFGGREMAGNHPTVYRPQLMPDGTHHPTTHTE
jgi:hypothetical protein